MLHEEPITVFGDGQQVRGNTYIDDCVAATVAATNAGLGETYNVGGGETATVLGIIHKLEALSGRRAIIEYAAVRPGDQQHTSADTTKLRLELGWSPETKLDDGLARQWEWQEREFTK
jgi:nucleoside-diphosphate-sugar epimerase